MESTVLDTLLGGNIPYITYAVPVFILLMALELIVAKVQQRQLYRFNDAVNNLSCGMIQQVVAMFTRFATIAGYTYLVNHFGLIDIASLSVAGKWVALFALLIGVDFCYYWFHRLSHEVNFLWAAHMVHHQSEEYNLAVALRQSSFQGWFSWAFYLPLAIIGFPVEWFAAVVAWNTLYQFWIHTCTIDKMGPLEWIINTPSHHRVHHGKNPQYIDRNHAGSLIIWDRLFGTFEPEGEPVVYGTTRELQSWNPLWANFQEWVALWKEAQTFERRRDRILIWFMEPGWKPEGMTHESNPPMTVETQVKYDTEVPMAINYYVLVHFVISLGGLVVVMVLGQSLETWLLALVGIWTGLSLTAMGGILESKSWAWASEPFRLLFALFLLASLTQGTAAFLPAMAVGLVISLIPLYWFYARRPRPSASAA